MSTYTPISSFTATTSISSVTIAGIPQNYTDLVLVASIRTTRAGESTDQWSVEINGDTGSNYSGTYLYNGPSSGRVSSTTNIGLVRCPGATATAGVFGYGIANFMNYSNATTYKTFITKWSDYTFYEFGTTLSLWRNTNAITSLKIFSTTSSNLASGATFNLYGIDAQASAQAKATGGSSIYTDGSYWYHIFNSSGTFTPTENLTTDYVVVAGGGGGGRRWDENLRGGGGGGAGGFRTSTDSATLSLTEQSYAVTVGAGGAGGNTGNPGNGYKGSNSVLSTISATGGGYGGGFLNSGGTGGSAGGHGRDRTVAVTAGNEGGYTPVEGFAGGRAESGGNGTGCGGGGGAGAVGANGNSSAAGNGGIGRSNTITNAALFGQLSGGNYYLAGGGGGTYSTGGTQGTGGLGGGGAGSATETGTGGHGTDNTGGGGGGGGGGAGNASGVGGNGGSGVVIIRYAV